MQGRGKGRGSGSPVQRSNYIAVCKSWLLVTWGHSMYHSVIHSWFIQTYSDPAWYATPNTLIATYLVVSVRNLESAAGTCTVFIFHVVAHPISQLPQHCWWGVAIECVPSTVGDSRAIPSLANCEGRGTPTPSLLFFSRTCANNYLATITTNYTVTTLQRCWHQ